MEQELLKYYEAELSYIRKLVNDFAGKYPKIADRLLLEGNRSQDPHVERLLQGFAFIAGRIRRKLDDDFPEMTEALLNILYPHYLAPVPSMSIVRFIPDATQGMLTGGYPVEQHTTLYSRPVNGTPCQFRTVYPLTLWPLEVESAVMSGPDGRHNWPDNARAMLTLRLRTEGGDGFGELNLTSLRFFLDGESRLTSALYEMLFNNAVRIELRLETPEGARSVQLPPGTLYPVGFAEEEGMLPYSKHAFIGYRLLQEYFVFPEKFLFFDLQHLEQIRQLGKTSRIDVVIYFDREHPLKDQVSRKNFLLGCTPVVNLFSKVAEPIKIDHTRSEYHLIPDLRRQPALEIYSIDRVSSTAPYLDKPLHYRPFYSYQHAYDEQAGDEDVFWYATRRPSLDKHNPGTEMYLSLVNQHYQPTQPGSEIVTVHTTCSNRDLPSRMPYGNPRGDFELEGAAPIARIRCLKKPTPSYRQIPGGAAQWRLVSHLALNHLSLTGDAEGRKALQEILRLYDFSNSQITRQQIAGLNAVRSETVVRRVRGAHGSSFARGLKIDLEFDEEKFVGSGVFMMAAVLARFLSLYVSINSFCELEVNTVQRKMQRKGPLKRWQPQAGVQRLL